jgi:hypothetical protein
VKLTEAAFSFRSRMTALPLTSYYVALLVVAKGIRDLYKLELNESEVQVSRQVTDLLQEHVSVTLAGDSLDEERRDGLFALADAAATACEATTGPLNAVLTFRNIMIELRFRPEAEYVALERVVNSLAWAPAVRTWSDESPVPSMIERQIHPASGIALLLERINEMLDRLETGSTFNSIDEALTLAGDPFSVFL